MKNLINATGKQPTVSSRVIAEQYGRRHQTVLHSIDSLIESGHITEQEFLLSEYVDKSGKSNKCYELTEDAFLIAMPFIGGKKAKDGQRALVKAFSRYRRQEERRAQLDWQQARAQGKIARRQETDVIQEFVKYAKDQGSKHAETYYINLTKASYKALFLVNGPTTGLREKLDPVQLSILATTEYVANQALQDGMNQRLPYKECFVLARDRMKSLGDIAGKTPLLPEAA